MRSYTGVSRRVFLIGSYAFKFPRFYRTSANSRLTILYRSLLLQMKGKEFWRGSLSYSSCFREVLCPITFSFFGFLIVMRRASILPQMTDLDLEGLILREWGEGLFESAKPILDMNSNSFGYLNGKLVCVD